MTTKSDVWSYGVCCWELFTRGEIPYSPLSDPQVIMDKIYGGYRLPQPKECSEGLYKLMLKCWAEEPSERPSFDEVLKNLEAQLPTEKAYVSEKTITNSFIEYN